jgi:hypothetical protein
MDHLAGSDLYEAIGCGIQTGRKAIAVLGHFRDAGRLIEELRSGLKRVAHFR